MSSIGLEISLGDGIPPLISKELGDRKTILVLEDKNSETFEKKGKITCVLVGFFMKVLNKRVISRNF